MPGSRMPGMVEPGLGQDPADCALAGSMAQAEQLALDSAVSPSRVLPGQVPGLRTKSFLLFTSLV